MLPPAPYHHHFDGVSEGDSVRPEGLLSRPELAHRIRPSSRSLASASHGMAIALLVIIITPQTSDSEELEMKKARNQQSGQAGQKQGGQQGQQGGGQQGGGQGKPGGKGDESSQKSGQERK